MLGHRLVITKTGASMTCADTSPPAKRPYISCSSTSKLNSYLFHRRKLKAEGPRYPLDKLPDSHLNVLRSGGTEAEAAHTAGR
jgi:hypothetical protein